MFRKVIVGIVTALFLALITFTPTTSAASGYWATSPANWELIESPGVKMKHQQGEISLFLTPLESIINGLDQSISLQYGILPGWELTTTLENRDHFVEGTLEVSHDLARRPNLLLTGVATLNYGEKTTYNNFNNWTTRYQYMNPGFKLLAAHQFNDQITLYNNVAIVHQNELDFQLNLEQGISYQIHPQHLIQARVLAKIHSPSQIQYNLKSSYRAKISDRVDYYFHLKKTFGESKLFYSNNVEIRPTDKFTLTGTFAYHSTPTLDNSIQLTGETQLTPDLLMVTEMTKSIRKYGYYGVRTGLRYTL